MNVFVACYTCRIDTIGLAWGQLCGSLSSVVGEGRAHSTYFGRFESCDWDLRSFQSCFSERLREQNNSAFTLQPVNIDKMGVPFEALMPYGLMFALFGITVSLWNNDYTQP